jgi:hypothetical protein
VTDDISPVLSAIDRDIENSIHSLFELLRFASIATDPAHAKVDLPRNSSASGSRLGVFSFECNR